MKSTILVACAMGSLLCAASVAIADDAKPAAEQAHNTKPDRLCMHDTGSRIPLSTPECQIAPGHSYTKQDIDSTGAATVGGALRHLNLR